MDSGGNEVIIVDEKLATTNGINGNHEEATVVVTTSDMKTRSKGTEGGAAATASPAAPEDATAKPKTRSTRTASAAVTNAQKNVNDEKAGSDSEKKDKKMNLRSGSDTETATKTPNNAAAADAKSALKKAAAADGTPIKKKGERDDDSGINSRSSSVSNEDTYSSRMRTRSKTAEALSSSTPASTKKGASRLPLYDFEDLSFDEYPSTSSGNALKRKATLYVEEMEEESENEAKNEPPAKRVVPFRQSFVNALLSPYRAIRGRISIASQTEKYEVAKGEVASQTHVSKVNDNEPEKEHAASQTESASVAAATASANDEKPPGTCAVM